MVALHKDLANDQGRLLRASDDKVSLDQASVEIDVLQFRRLAVSPDKDALRHAATLYRGELLADFDVRDAAFEDWLSAERRQLADIAGDVLERLCDQETGLARVAIAKRLVAIDALRESSHRILMQAYADAGEKGLALRQYEVCRDALRDEFSVPPGPETEALRHRLLKGSTGQTAAPIPGHTAPAAPYRRSPFYPSM